MTLVRGSSWRSVRFLALVSAVAPIAAWAQDAVIQGRVIDDRGEVLAAAFVQIQELGIGVYAGTNGRYTLLVPARRVSGQTVTLRARLIGRKVGTRQITLQAGEQTQDFTLAADVNQLEEVVVTGVSEATERVNVPFSVTRIDASKLAVTAQDPLTELEGKIPADIVSNSGRPGAQPAVLLRGPTSLNAVGRSQDPLYIVDGVIINGALPDLNPADIESVEIVKGAAGASLYGARAGNGVINITTRGGRRGEDGVTFSARSEGGLSDIERDFGIARYSALLMDEHDQQFCAAVTGQPTCARTFDYAYEEARVNNAPTDWAAAPPSFPVDPGATIAGPVLRQRFQITPWPGQVYNAVRQAVNDQPYVQNDVDMSGHYGNTRFYGSYSNLTDRGAIQFLQGFVRNSFRANVDQAIGSQWNIGIRTYYSRDSQDGLNQEDGGSAFFRLTRVPGIDNITAQDSLGRLYIRPNLQGGGGQNSNPLYQLANIVRSDIANRFIGGGTLQYNPVSWATFEANIGYDLRRADALQFRDKGYRSTGPTPDPTTNLGFIYRANEKSEEVNGSVNAAFRHDFGSDLRTHYSLRYLYEQRDSLADSGQGDFLAFKGIQSLTNATADKVLGSWTQSIREISLFAGGGLVYKDRYVLDGLVRRDGSSLFGADQRWSTFGRLSGAWRVAREPWWFTPKVTELKLRASYGSAGSSPAFASQYETVGVGAGGIPLPQFLGNKNLRPEVNKELELGTDIELLGRFGLSATYARAHINDQILPVPVSAGTGYLQQWQNVGELLNITHELTLTLPFVTTPNVAWTMAVSYDHNRSFISRLDVPSYFYGAGLQATDQIFLAQQGQLIGTFYGRAFLTSCGQLPAPFNAQCGGPTSAFQKNNQGFIVWVGPGNNPGMGITNNLWQAQLPGSQSPWGVALNWGMPIILRGAGANGQSAQIVALGNALPDFRFSITQDVTWRRLSLHAILDASIGQSVWDQGFHWAHLDFLSKDVDQAGQSVQSAKPIGYYYRAGPPDNNNGLGGLYDILGPNNFSVEKASFAKLRELLVAYRVGSVSGVGDWTVSLVARNLFTITGYRGFDPEVGIGSSTGAGGQLNSGALNAVDAFTFPNLRTFSLGLRTAF